MSQRYGLIGHNISYSKSPRFHLFMSKKLGMNVTYDLLDVEADEAEDGEVEGASPLVEAAVERV